MAQERLSGLAGVEIAENVHADERACHLHLEAGTDTAPFARLADAGQLTGLSAERADRLGIERLMGVPVCERRPALLRRAIRDRRCILRRECPRILSGEPLPARTPHSSRRRARAAGTGR